MRKIEQLITCHGKDCDFNVAVVGTGKNPQLYFFEVDVYYPDDHFDSVELPFKVGVDAKYIEEWFLQMDMKTFKKLTKTIK
jgi:hypothetical protein